MGVLFFAWTVAGVYDDAGLLPCGLEAGGGFGGVELEDEVVEVGKEREHGGDVGFEFAADGAAVDDVAAWAVECGFVGLDGCGTVKSACEGVTSTCASVISP